VRFSHIVSLTVLTALLLCGAAAQGQMPVVGDGSVAGQPRVTEITVEGNEHVSQDRVVLGFGFALGDEPTTEGIRDGVRRVYAMGHFSDVQVFVEPADDEGLRLIIVVEERPRVSTVEIRGNDHVNSDDIEAALRIERGVPFDESRLEDSRMGVLALYESKGFPSATVETRVADRSGNNVEVILDIDEGTRVIVREIRFTGTGDVPEKELRDAMETKEDRWWRTDAFFDREVLDMDLVRVVERFRREGYIDATALGYDTLYEDEGERVTITINMDSGELYDVTAIEWVGASEFAVDALYDLTTVTPGDAYSPEQAEQTIRDAYAWYGERGYIHARIFKQEVVSSGHELAVVFNVDESEPARVGRIHIAGNTRTKEKIIRRELTIQPGDLYQTSEVISSQRKVANLGFFHGPMVEFMDSASPDDIDLVFTVEERQTGRAGVGVSHTSEKGITGFLELSEGNLFGNGQYLDVKWEFGKRNTELVLGFTEPWFMNRRLSVGFDLYDTNDKRTYSLLPNDFFADAFSDTTDADIWAVDDGQTRYYVVERERRGGDVRVGWPFFGSRHTMLYNKYTLEQVKLYEYGELTTATTDEETEETTYDTEVFPRTDDEWEWRSGLTTTLMRRTTDRRFHPRLGSYTRATADLFGSVFGGDVEYQRYIVESRTFVPAPLGLTLMLRGRAGLVTGYGDPGTVPNDTRFELGGVGLNGVRGYDDRSILPEGSDLYGGRTMLIGSAELKFPVMEGSDTIPVYVLGFVDAGNTWESREDTHPSDLYWGAGVGVRVEVPVLGNMGIDMGYGFDEELGGEWQVHYRFGMEY